MRFQNNKTITDDKTKASLKGYLTSHTNSETREMEQLVPQLRGFIEAGNFPAARKAIEAIGEALGSTLQTLEYFSAMTNTSLYTEEEMTKAAEGMEKGYEDAPKKMSRKGTGLY